jgi:diguanylate cyclase
MACRDHDYTLALGKMAMAKIEALSLPADPPGYELWYRYAAGNDPELNQTINRALEAGGALSTREVDEIYNRHVPSARMQADLELAGDKVSGEVEKVVELLDELILSTSESREDCAKASTKLAQSTDRNSVRAIADALIRSLRAVEVRHSALERRLSAAKRELDVVQNALATMSVEASRDPLTGLANRREFERALEEAMERAARDLTPLSLLMVDIDHFKSFNDQFGHIMGDSVLSLVAAVMKQSIKGQDVAARYGGEEFAVILPNTILANARTVAQQLCDQVASRELMRRSSGESLGAITVSIGAASYRGGERARTFIERADSSLYDAKRAGRNCVKCEANIGERTEDAA